MELRDALSQISQIRRQMADAQVYRGYRAFPTACSGGLAFAAAIAQAVWLPEPAAHVSTFIGLWIGVAAVSFAMAGVEMVWHCRRYSSPHSDPWRAQATWLALEQLIPFVVAGGLMTWVLYQYAPEAIAVLPGLWQVLFGLGLLASRRILPWPFPLLAVLYIASGLFCVAWGRGSNAFSPLVMGVPFGVGQILAATILYWKVERHDAE